jgi:hypothetical protein
MASLSSASRRNQTAKPTTAAPVHPATQRPFQNAENAGESGWMHPEAQARPAAKFGGAAKKMHAPGFRGRK